MGLSLAENYVTVVQAAALLHMNRSTIRRWIRKGLLPAYRIGQRRVALKRTDLAMLITFAHMGTQKGGDGARTEPLLIRRLTPEQQRRGLETLARI